MLMHCEDVSFSKISRELCNVEKPEYPHSKEIQWLWNKWHPKFLLPMLIHCEDISVLKISRDVCN
ncbi:hypothetical protein T4B_1424 [Trichinella pseudospiralis]|uniref:Uncharacterized protein n=2 Tax=Trichinella pseudospiralis TaxID=6337 RepID=A0A0V1GMY6_TRIPS|nr:hypothetical protein T4B_1424 [Trichinella pseudospiralis]